MQQRTLPSFITIFLFYLYLRVKNAFCKCHLKVLSSCFHLNGDTILFHLKTQKVEKSYLSLQTAQSKKLDSTFHAIGPCTPEFHPLKRLNYLALRNKHYLEQNVSVTFNEMGAH